MPEYAELHHSAHQVMVLEALASAASISCARFRPGVVQCTSTPAWQHCVMRCDVMSTRDRLRRRRRISPFSALELVGACRHDPGRLALETTRPRRSQVPSAVTRPTPCSERDSVFSRVYLSSHGRAPGDGRVGRV